MAGRAVTSPRSVPAVSLGSTNELATDRVMQQAGDAIESLQGKVRAAAATADGHGDSIATLTARTMAFNVKDYGAVGDGATDDADAINAAITAAAAVTSGAAVGGFAEFPPGTYLIRSPIVQKPGTGLRGAGPPATIIKLANTFSDTSAIRNEHQDGTQEYAFIESLQIEGNKAGGAVCSEALVSWGSLFINSYIRDVVILDSSSVGLRVFASNGMGPILIENVWVLHSGGHNVLIEEVIGNANAATGILCVNLTSEHQGESTAGSSALCLKGVGSAAQWNFYNTHIEQGTAATGRFGIKIDGVSHVLIDGVQLLADATTVAAGIRITNVVQSNTIQIRGVYNPNLINPILEDLKNGVTYAAGNVPWYVTPEVVAPPALNFLPIGSGNSAVFQNAAGAAKVWLTADGQLTGSSPNLAGLDVVGAGAGPAGDDRAQTWLTHAGGNIYGLVYPNAGGGVLDLDYITGGSNILRFGTDGSFRHMSTKIGFFAAAATTKPTITGSRAGNAALASLLTAGATLGLWIDSTTA